MGWSRGHCFFSLFVNDIPDTVNAKVKMYADDSKVYERQSESDSLQRDLYPHSTGRRFRYGHGYHGVSLKLFQIAAEA